MPKLPLFLKLRKKTLTRYHSWFKTMVFLFAADEMSTISKQFKMGFGSFVDKAVMPFVSTAKNK